MKIQWGVKFILHKRHSGDTKASIRMRVTLRGQTPIDFPTRLDIDIEQWDTTTQHALSAAPGASVINRTIDEWKAAINEIFARYELLEKRVPTVGEIKDLFNDMVGRKTKTNENVPNPTDNLFAVFDIFTETMGNQNQWTPATHEKFAALKRHLQDFDKNLSFPQVTETKMQQYLAYLNKQGFRNTTIAKHLAFVRWFFRWAASKGYYDGDIHDTFKPKLKGIDGNAKEIIYLTQEEIKLLENYQFLPTQKALEQVRDVFLFCCFTGLRYSDVAKLRKTDVKDGFINVVTQKTVDGLRIELNKHSGAILDKYKDKILPRGLALPVIANTKMNAHLKILGQLCGIDEPTRIVYFQGNVRHEEVFPKWALLTTHCGRRTFVVTALQLGIPSEVIMKWTGHNDFSAMKPYVKIVDELKERAMSRFDNL